MKSSAPEVIFISLFYQLMCVVLSKEKNLLTQIPSFDIIQFVE